ncbi:MAG: hypothetical protein PVH61_30455 [Candidatus Aminicenantes bacterium]
MNIQPAREPEMEVLYCNNIEAQSYTVADDQTTHQVSFIFDASQGRFEERPGNGCENPVKNNPHFVWVRVIPYDYTIVDCEVRDAWDTGWFQCPDIAIDEWIPNSTFITLNTDPYQTDVSQSGCPWNSIPRYLIGTIGYFQIRLYDDLGNVFFRRINLKRIRMTAQQQTPVYDQ